MIGELTNHLWQSTLFAAIAWLLAAAFRKNRAQVRYCLWLSASLKFLFPFSLLMSVGSQLDWAPGAHEIATQIATPSVTYTVEQIAQPFPIVLQAPSSVQATAADWLPLAVFAVWICGFSGIAAIRLRAWRRIRSVVGASIPVEIPALEIRTGVRIRSCPGLLEPGVVRLFRPILLLPAGIAQRLTPHQLAAVVAHELCHIRRRDNLTSAFHMIIEAVFWFHPLVWWIGARLVEERERACDEEVLRLGNEPQVYAEGILNVCKLYRESPLVCVSGVTGSNLKKRIEEIMRNRAAHRLSFSRAVLLVMAAIAALAGPIAMGIVNATAGRAQSVAAIQSAPSVPPAPRPDPAAGQRPATVQVAQAPPAAPRTASPTPAAAVTFDVASVRPSTALPGGGLRRGGPGPAAGGPPAPAPPAPGPCFNGPMQSDPTRFVITNATLYTLITLAYGKHCRGSSEADLIIGGPGWIRTDQFDIQAVNPAGTPGYTPLQLRNGEAPELQVMLQTLLADRFKLTMRREMREMPVYNLVVASAGKLKLSEDQTSPAAIPVPVPPPPPGPRTGPPPVPPNLRDPSAPPPPMPRGAMGFFIDPPSGMVTLNANAVSMKTIVGMFQGQLTRVIIDKTEIKGLVDLPALRANVGTFEIGPNAVSVWPQIASEILEKQLGLKLEQARAPVEVFVIEFAEKPSEN